MTVGGEQRQVTFFLRARGAGISIERLFVDIAKAINEDRTVRKWHCPFPGGRNRTGHEEYFSGTPWIN